MQIGAGLICSTATAIGGSRDIKNGLHYTQYLKNEDNKSKNSLNTLDANYRIVNPDEEYLSEQIKKA